MLDGGQERFISAAGDDIGSGDWWPRHAEATSSVAAAV